MRYIMAVDVNVQSLYGQQTGSIQAAGSSAVDNTSAPIELVDKKVVEGEGNMDVAQTNNTSNIQTTQQRTVDELYNSIAALCTQYGISLSEAKKIGLMEKIAGVPQEELLNMPNSEIQKHIECLKAALKKLSAYGKIDLEELATLANNYNVAIHTGWSIEGFEEAQSKNSESIAERFERFFGVKDLYSCSEEKIKEYLKRYFDNFFKEKIEKGMSREEAVKLQLQDFAKLLINTPEDKRQIFIDAAKSLLSENRPEGFESLFRSYTDDAKRTETADSVTVEDIEELTTVKDNEGNAPDMDGAARLSAAPAKYRSEDGSKEYHEQFNESAKNFFEKNKEALAIIDEKLLKGEELTEQEQELLLKRNNLYVAGAAGEMAGTANNVGISDEFKNQILKIMNSDAYELPIYREVMEQVVSFIENHPETMTMPVEEFVKLMDEVTNGNYSTVVNDIEKGTTTPLNEPADIDDLSTEPAADYPESSAGNTYGVGFSNTDSIDTSKPETHKIQLYDESNETPGTAASETTIKTDNIVEAAKSGVDGLKLFVKDNGSKIAIVEVFKNLKYLSQGVVNVAIRMYETFAESIQADTLKKVTNEGFNILLAHTSDKTLLSLKGETFPNFYATQQLDDAVEKVEEKRA